MSTRKNSRSELPAMETRRLTLTQGEAPGRNPDYVGNLLRMSFFELSYRGGCRYKSGLDADGLPVFVEHEQESPEGAKRRKRLATYRGYCKPICDRFNSYVFTSHVSRSSDQGFEDWSSDVDGRGTPLNEFMRLASLRATILGQWYILADTSKQNEYETVAQSSAAGNRMLLSNLHPSRVLDWSNDGSQLLVRHDDMGDHGCVRLWSDTDVQVGILDDQGKLASVTSPEPHGWDRMPIVSCRGVGLGQSLVEDVAELTKSIFNLDSLLREELSKQTFSQFWACGLTKDDLVSVNTGSRKIICVNKPAADVAFNRFAADPSQAQSIRDSIAADEDEIYRIVGLRRPDISAGGPESGKSLKIRFSETSSLAASIADSVELAEGEVTALYNSAYGADILAADYPDEFNDEDLAVELKKTLDTIANQFPASVKIEQVVAYVRKAFANLSNEERTALLQDVRGFYSDMPEPSPVGVQPETEQPEQPAQDEQTEQQPTQPDIPTNDQGEKSRIAAARAARDSAQKDMPEMGN